MALIAGMITGTIEAMKELAAMRSTWSGNLMAVEALAPREANARTKHAVCPVRMGAKIVAVGTVISPDIRGSLAIHNRGRAIVTANTPLLFAR
jgi:hypothetical protein